MAKYKAYPEYKDSGVEWLGAIPDHWTTLAIKHVVQLNPSKSCISIEKMKGMCSFIPMEKLKFNSLSLDEVKDVSDVYNGYTYFENEDILIAKVTPCFENKNMVVAHDLHNGIGFGSSEIYVLRCNDIINNDFLFYRLQEDNFMSIAEGAMTGAGGLKRVPSEVLNNFKFGLPGKKEQSIIVDFLKHETAKIDKLIEKQQQLIELLKEKRQAVISHAVTKGLNPDVPMKDSGVEWLGNIPEHWEQSRIGWVCNVGNGCTPSRENALFWQNGSYPWLNSSKVNDERILTAEQFVTTKALYECSLPIVKKGSVIMAITGEGKTRGTSALMMINATINQHVAYITPRAKDKISPEFIHLWLQSKYQQIRTSSEGWGSTKAAITCSDVKCYPIPVPPLKEQAEIVRAIEEKKTIFTNLLLSCEKEIEILQERRTALISAAVTGKIDVRDWVAPDTQNVEEPQEATA